ncbi:MAG: LytR/AlgR family response regulator transcription factor [Saprospiraceae bacterium]
MTNYTALIIDDEQKLRKVLQIKLEQFCKNVKVIGTAANSTEGFEKINQLKPQIVFLDISMPGESGFDMLNRFTKIDFEIIFVTGFNDYILDALKVSAVDYLLKPVGTEELIDSVTKACKRIDDREKIKRYDVLRHNLGHLGEQDTKLAIPGTNAYDFVKMSDIIRCEGWQKYTRIYITDGSCLVSSYNIGIFKEMLESYGFYSTHKSHLINVSLISKYLKEGTVVMTDGSNVPVARRKKEEFVDKILKGFLLGD